MIVNRLLFSFGLLSLGTLVACSNKKEEEQPRFDPTGTYTLAATANAGPVRMFTRSGEVRNAQLIRRYAERMSAGLFYLPSGVLSPYSTAELTFGSNGQASLTGTSRAFPGIGASTFALDVTSQTNDHLVLTAMLPASFYRLLASNNCDNIMQDIRAFSPIYTLVAMPPASGFAGRSEYHPLYVLNLDGTQASLALMSYSFSAGSTSQRCSMSYRDEFNTLNATLPGRLAAGDTLVVQESAVPLTKK